MGNAGYHINLALVVRYTQGHASSPCVLSRAYAVTLCDLSTCQAQAIGLDWTLS